MKAPVAQIDRFSTILDYCGIGGHESEGASLRPLIESGDDGAKRIAVSEWNGTAVPGFMVFDGRWKLLFGRGRLARSVDAFYDLQNDPNELHNVLAGEADREKLQAEAERMKALLLAWLDRVKAPYLDEVKARPIAQKHR